MITLNTIIVLQNTFLNWGRINLTDLATHALWLSMSGLLKQKNNHLNIY